MFIQRFFESDPMPAFIQVLVVIFAVCCHEFAHAWVALKQGDSTAADAGHLTLNPLKQMGLFSLIMLAFLGLAWGAVPVNPSRMRHKYSEVLVALAGPLTNLALFVIFTIMAVINANFIKNSGFTLLFGIGAIFNIVLFIFNMLPIPSLDGWTVFRRFIQNRVNLNSEFVKGMMIFLILVLVIFSEKLFQAGTWLFLHFAGLVNTLFIMVGMVKV